MSNPSAFFQLSATFWRDLHSGIAVAGGVLFVAITLAGSALWLLQPSVERGVEPVSHRLSLDRAFSSITAQFPEVRGAWTLELPFSPSSPLAASHREGGELFTALLDPVSGAVMNSYPWQPSALTGIYQLHTQLLLGEAGRWLVGMIGCVFLLVFNSGFWLWLSQRAQSKSNGRQTPFALSSFCDRIHRMTGIVFLPILTFATVTGIVLAMPTTITWFSQQDTMNHGALARPVRSTAQPDTKRLGLEEATLVARGLFPHAELRRVTTPAADFGPYKIELCQRSEDDCRHPQTVVWIDQFSGQIRDVENPMKYSWGQRLMSRIGYLHSGAGFGLMGGFVWFITGLTPSLLFATGLQRWMVRRGLVRDRLVSPVALQAACLSAGRSASSRFQQSLRELKPVAAAGIDWLLRTLRQHRHKYFD